MPVTISLPIFQTGCVVVAEEQRLHFFLPRRAVLRAVAHQRHLAADVLAQQLVGLEQVVFVVLLEHADLRRLGERSEVHRRRIDRGGDVHEAQVAGAARQLQVADVAHQRDVGVVDGERQLGLIVERGGQILTIDRSALHRWALVRPRPSGSIRPQQEGAASDGEDDEIRACGHWKPLLGKRGRHSALFLRTRRAEILAGSARIRPASSVRNVRASAVVTVAVPSVGGGDGDEIDGCGEGQPCEIRAVGGQQHQTVAPDQPAHERSGRGAADHDFGPRQSHWNPDAAAVFRSLDSARQDPPTSVRIRRHDLQRGCLLAQLRDGADAGLVGRGRCFAHAFG